jgi:hypothetical protein
MDGDFSQQTGKLITFVVTAISMAIGFNLIPFFPSPLPIIIAFLVAYAVYKNKPYGAIAGSATIALGLFYHLSRIGFFQLLESPLKNSLFMALLFSPFLILPAIITNNLQVIAMDIGIIAVSLLFFKQTFYLAIPLILVFATIYKGRGVIFTFIYYTFMSIPLQVMQYLKTYTEGSVPPLYTPLNLIYSDIQRSMSTVSLQEILKVLNTIMGLVPPDAVINGERAALASFINSIPGMMMFFIIMSGLISVIAILNTKLPDPVSENPIPGKYINVLVYVVPIFAAALTNIAFFVSIDTLQDPLSFQAMVGREVLISSTMFTVLFSAPMSFSKYIVDLKEVKESRSNAIRKGSKEYLEKIGEHIKLIESLGYPVPENFINLKTRMLIIQDELKDIHRKALNNLQELSDIDTSLRRLFNDLRVEMESLETHLDVALRDYYIKIKFEYLESISEIKDMGLEVDAPKIQELDLDDPIKVKLEKINQINDSGKVLVEELLETSDKIYEVISSLFEPSLPSDSATLQISRQKIEEDKPWVIIDAILSSLKNWERQYSSEILKATKPINDGIEAIIQLREQEDKLRPLLREKFNIIEKLTNQIKERKVTKDEENLKVLKVNLIRDKILSTVNIVGQIISVLYDEIKELEADINSLLPREDFDWNRNLTLTERMDQSLRVLKNYKKYDINEIVNHLYKVLSYIDESIETIEYYNERKEMFLNYPVFKKKIRRLLNKKYLTTIEDLGVSEKYGMEYLKIYHRTNIGPLVIDESMSTLRRTKDD